jgi:hypothetical protein
MMLRDKAGLLRVLAEWAWRLAMLGAVLWVGWQVAQLREDILDLADPGDDQTETATRTSPAASNPAPPALAAPGRPVSGVRVVA